MPVETAGGVSSVNVPDGDDAESSVNHITTNLEKTSLKEEEGKEAPDGEKEVGATWNSDW